MGAAPGKRAEEEHARRRRHKHLLPRRPKPRGATEASNQRPGQPDYEVKADLRSDKPKKEGGEARVQKTIANASPGGRSEHERRKQNVIPEFVTETPQRSVRAKHG